MDHTPQETDTFLVARNPDGRSRLLYVLRLPVDGERAVVLATAGTRPSSKDLFCYGLAAWPEGAEVLETVPVERCWRAGAAVHLVLRRRRSLLVWTTSRGWPLIFWRSQSSMRGARPGIRVPQARGLERALAVAVDVHERYPWRFARYAAQTERRALPVGDYAVLDGDRCAAAVERKSITDLARGATGGELALSLAELGRLPHGALIVEGRRSDLVKEGRRGEVRPGWLLNLVATLQVAHPQVAWVFAETRSLAEDYAYRWLAASAHAEPGDRPAVAVAESPTAYPGPALLNATARQRLALEGATQGVTWTTGAFAARCGVSAATAAKDLKALVDRGALVAEGQGRGRRYRAPQPPASPPNPGAGPGTHEAAGSSGPGD